MSLESVANELLIDLFGYLSIADVLRAFSGLNSRLDDLIIFFIRCCHHLDCRLMSKSQLNFICQEHLPAMVGRISSLSLSDSDETPEQINRFFSYNLNLDRFIHLRSLSFYHLSSKEIMGQMMATWGHLPYLTHLKFSECYFRYRQNDVLQMMNSIWSLSQLTHCHLDMIFRWATSFMLPTVSSFSLESLIIKGIDCPANELLQLFQNTIRLRHFCATISPFRGDVFVPLPISPMITLKLKFSSSFHSSNVICNLFENMHNLRQLSVETMDIFLDGHQWKKIISDYLPKLKIFRLKMEFFFRDRVNTKHYADQLLNSFQTDFWLEEHRWFVRCHYHPQSTSNYVCLYTLPYSFTSFPRIEVSGCQSTCPDEDYQYWSYDHVRTLNYRAPLSEELMLHQPRFVNIEHLVLSFNVHDQFWTIVPRFTRLASLEVSLHGRAHDARFQLQTILDRAPYLYLLKFGSWRPLEVPIADIISPSVRQLDLRESDQYLSDSECLRLINSPLGIQCELLRINVANRISIVDLVTGMTNLQSLNVRCEGDNCNEQLAASIDELLTWLQLRLPSTCTIVRHTRYIFDILVWIR